MTGGVGQVGVGGFGSGTPMPSVLKREQLRVALPARLILENDVVVAIRVEGRVEVDEVDAGVGDVATEDLEVVAVVQDVGVHAGDYGRRLPRPADLRRGFQASPLHFGAAVGRRRSRRFRVSANRSPHPGPAPFINRS